MGRTCPSLPPSPRSAASQGCEVPVFKALLSCPDLDLHGDGSGCRALVRRRSTGNAACGKTGPNLQRGGAAETGEHLEFGFVNRSKCPGLECGHGNIKGACVPSTHPVVSKFCVFVFQKVTTS